jgi:hypothetical protein
MYQRDELQRQLAAELECDNNTTQFWEPVFMKR